MKSPTPDALCLPPLWESQRQELLAGKVIHLWRIDLRAWTQQERALHALLSPAEQARFARLQRQADRTRSIVARGLLRQVLAACLETADALVIREGDGEKPRLADNPQHLDFNIAHSGDYALIALAAGTSVGVDIEQLRDAVEIDAIAPTVFTLGEWNPVASRDIATRKRGFFRGWVRKEALIKAMGEGLRAPLLQIEVGCSPHFYQAQTANLLSPDALPTAAAAPWRMTDLEAPTGYFAALAWAGEARPVRCFTAKCEEEM